MIEERGGKFEVKMDEALPVAVGAIATGVADGVIEAFAAELDAWGRTWGFPAWAGLPLLGIQPLPPLDDWIIDLVGPSAAALIGAIIKNKDVTNAGIGGLIFGVPELLANMIIRAKQTWVTTPAAAAAAAARSAAARSAATGAPNFVVRTASRYTVRG